MITYFEGLASLGMVHGHLLQGELIKPTKLVLVVSASPHATLTSQYGTHIEALAP